MADENGRNVGLQKKGGAGARGGLKIPHAYLKSIVALVVRVIKSFLGVSRNTLERRMLGGGRRANPYIRQFGSGAPEGCAGGV
jgi:hypothetical protein